jgi:hypothetical protein
MREIHFQRVPVGTFILSLTFLLTSYGEETVEDEDSAVGNAADAATVAAAKILELIRPEAQDSELSEPAETTERKVWPLNCRRGFEDKECRV